MVLIDGMNQWNYVMWLITDFLPRAPAKVPQLKVHISHLLQKCKKGKALTKSLPF